MVKMPKNKKTALKYPREILVFFHSHDSPGDGPEMVTKFLAYMPDLIPSSYLDHPSHLKQNKTKQKTPLY